MLTKIIASLVLLLMACDLFVQVLQGSMSLIVVTLPLGLSIIVLCIGPIEDRMVRLLSK